MTTRLTKVGAVAAGLTIALWGTACGASPVGAGGGSTSGESGTALEEVYAAVEGLTGAERSDKLVELAQEAGGEVGWYYVSKLDPVIDAFEEQTGLTISAYQGISEDLAERAGQEFQTDQQGSDVILAAAADLKVMNGEGLLGELKSPVLDDVADGYKGFNTVSPYTSVMVLAYNNDLIPPDRQPGSYQELFENPPGAMGVETGDWQWYEALVRTYFMEQKGMSEQQAIDLITQGMQGAQQVEGHSLLAELLASGQYGATPTAFAHSVELLVKAQSPIAYGASTADTPPFLIVNTMALTKGGHNPAGGLALMEWLMSAEGQKMFADMNFGTTSSAYTGPSVLDTYPNSIVADLYLTDSPEETRAWQAKYQELLQSIGGKPAS